MKPYKKLFRESNNLVVDSIREVEKLVPINHLEWLDGGIKTWIKAVDDCPFGWRLPTVQELYSCYVKKNEHYIGLPVMPTDFVEDYYWSSSVAPDSNYAWYFDFLTGGADSYNKTNNNYVKYVKGKRM